MAEARELRMKEAQRKADVFGAENVFRTQRAKGPLLPPPKLLVDTRAEEQKARKEGMDKARVTYPLLPSHSPFPSLC